MKANNLSNVEKSLKFLAKRYRTVKYSLGLTILFLMMGVNAFSEDVLSQEVMTNEQIANSKENLKNSVESLQSKINAARKENAKSLSGLKLELIQLMEQGNQIVKSSWTSWQFATGYVYNSWGKAYKGYRDKKENEILVRQSSSDLNRFLANNQSSLNTSSYGSTDLGIVTELPAEIEVTAGIRPKNINKEAPSYTPVAPAGALPPFEPKLISPPAKLAAPVEVSPTTFSPPDIDFKGKGFPQGAIIGMPKNNIIIQNYDSYDTVDKNTATKGVLNIEVGNLGGGIKSRWWGTNLNGTANPNVQMKSITNVPNVATPGLTIGGFNPGGAGTFGMNAFINELRDHNANISGNYVLTNKGGEGATNRNIIFLSHNPAGVGTPGYDGVNAPNVKTATFNGTLTLNGTPTAFTGSTASSDVTIGVEHQLFSAGHQGAYSIFENKGTINLASGII